MGKQKTMALVAHDNRKEELLQWAESKRDILKHYHLVGTSHTAQMITEKTGIKVEPIAHGPDGGDILIAARILEGQIDELIFFIDARTPHGHEHDIQTLIRICVIRDIPIALNRTTADLMVQS